MMKNNKGITLIELLIIVVIIGIIAAVSVPAVGRIITNTQNRALEASLINMEQSVRLYRLDRRDLDPESFFEVMRFNPNVSTTNANWEIYGDRLLGDYISGDWPKPPFGGVFSYRFFTLDNNFPAPNLRQLTRNAEGDIVPGSSLGSIYSIPRGSTTGEFLQIRFGNFQTTAGGGVFNLDDELTRENTEMFLRTVNFLLDTQFGDQIFVWHRSTNSPTLSGTADSNRAQLVIFIYLDHE